METYRLYFMTAEGAHIDRFEAIEARDDVDAIRFAEIYIGPQPLELWLRNRKVVSFDTALSGTPRTRTTLGQGPGRSYAPLAKSAPSDSCPEESPPRPRM